MNDIHPKDIFNQLISHIENNEIDLYKEQLLIILNNNQYYEIFQSQLTSFINAILKSRHLAKILCIYIECEDMTPELFHGITLITLSKPAVSISDLDLIFQSYLNSQQLKDFSSTIYSYQLAITLYSKKEDTQDLAIKYNIFSPYYSGHQRFFNEIVSSSYQMNHDFLQFYFQQFKNKDEIMNSFIKTIFKLEKGQSNILNSFLNVWINFYSQLSSSQQAIIKSSFSQLEIKKYNLPHYEYLMQQLEKIDLYQSLEKNEIKKQVNHLNKI